ncbi:MAG: HAD hydrolase family protein [Gemmatimonadetes bacterium]|nr:HAD hydrolase family protein [Gemmatimonadota bacterium]
MTPPPHPALVAKAARIRLLLTDVDGVWTDGRMLYVPGADDQIVETKAVSALDGQGFRWWHAAGDDAGYQTGRESPGITFRAQMLGVTYNYQNRLEKIEPYEEILADVGVTDDEVAYIGDDLPDTPLLRRVGLGAAVANARNEVKAVADYVTLARGGDGAVREVIELILRARGQWQDVLDRYSES